MPNDSTAPTIGEETMTDLVLITLKRGRKRAVVVKANGELFRFGDDYDAIMRHYIAQGWKEASCETLFVDEEMWKYGKGLVVHRVSAEAALSVLENAHG